MKYKFKTKPYKHQREAMRFLLGNKFGGALLMEPRTGKTKTVIDYLCVLAKAGKIDRAIVVCPARVMDVWVQEFHTHASVFVNTSVWDKNARKRPIAPVSSVHDLTVVIVNYDAFGTPGRKLASGRRSRASGRFKHRQLLQKWVAGKPCAGILDESHKIKAPSGRSANMVVSMATMFQYRVLMTGTPVTKAKRIHDLYMQWMFLNPDRLEELDLKTASEVREFTGVWINKNGFPQWLRPRENNVQILREAIHQDSFAIKREECFDLPDREEEIIKVNLSRRSAKIYDDMANDMIAEVEELKETEEKLTDLKSHSRLTSRILHQIEETQKEIHTLEASIRIVQNLRFAQITSGIGMTDKGKLIRIGNEKLQALEEKLELIFEHDEKVVISARFKADLDSIYALVRKFKVPGYQLRGGMKRNDSTAAIRQFKNRDEAAAFIMQPQAGSLGIDLSTSSRMVWYSLVPSWTDFTQSCDRIALSRRSTTFTHLIADGTYDQLLYDTLKEDGQVARLITDRPEVFLRKK